MSQLEFDESI